MTVQHRVTILLATLLLLTSCSDAESPVFFDGGALENTTDGGDGLSERDQPCTNGSCAASALICVEDDTSSPGDAFCRLRCEVTSSTTFCGEQSRCQELSDGSFACLPAGGLDEACPCDDGFVCVNLDAGDNRCKTACDPNGDGSECAQGERCAPFSSGNGGACVD